MRQQRTWIALGLIVVIAAAIALGFALTRGPGSGPRTVATRPDGSSSFERRYRESRLGEGRAAVLAHWPKVPYQHYSDNLRDDCFEWKADNLYNLCFKAGVLRLKTVF